MKMFRILVKIDDKCYNCKVRTKNQIIQGIGKMAEATRRGVNTKPNGRYSERILTAPRTYSENINIRCLSSQLDNIDPV
jgi:hypothetical protein